MVGFAFFVSAPPFIFAYAFRRGLIFTMLGELPRYASQLRPQEYIYMDLQFSAEEEAFRLQVRGWLAENMPKDFASGREGREDKEWLGGVKKRPPEKC